MQSKLIAAAVASGASALNLELIGETGGHTQDPAHEEGSACIITAVDGEHFGFGYDPFACLEEKTDRALEKVFDDIVDGGDGGDTNQDIKDQVLDDLRELKDTLENGLDDTVKMLTDALDDKIAQADANINGAVDEGIEKVCNAMGEDMTDKVIAKRDEIEQWVKDLVYKCNHVNLESADYCDPYEVKESIQYKLEYFDRFLDEIMQGSLQEIIDEVVEDVEKVIADEKQCIADVLPGAIDQFDSEAAAAKEAIDAAIADAMDALEEALGDELDDIVGPDGVPGNIAEEFLELFWHALEDIYTYVDPYERRTLIHKALQRKDDFLARLEDALKGKEGDSRTCREVMYEKFAECRDEICDYIDEERTDLIDGTNGSIDDIADDALNRLLTTLESKTTGDGGMFEEQARFLEEWVHKIASHLVKHKPLQFKPHAALVTNRLQGQINTYGDVIFATFDGVTGAAVSALNNVVSNQSMFLHGDQLAATTSLDVTLAGLINNIIAVRQNMEMEITAMQDEQEARDSELREIDQVGLVTTKNQLWKDLSWTMRKAYGGHSVDEPVKSHGYAQVSTNPFGFDSKTELWDEIKAHLDAMTVAQEEITAANEDRIGASKDALDVALGEAVDAYVVVLDEKKAAMQAAVDEQNALFDASVAAKTDIVNAAVATATQAIADASVAKKEALDHLEKEIRWGITAVYNDLWQSDLEAAMDVARAEADALCAEKEAALAAQVAQALADWNSAVDTETATLGDNTAADIAGCDASATEQSDTLDEFKLAAEARFNDWAEAERAALAEFVADCSDAWNTILASYCLDDIEYLDEHHNGLAQVADSDINFGLGKHYSHGCRAFGQIGGYEKNEIEAHDEILSYGQDLEIRHIDDIPERIAAAVDYVMAGVPEVMEEQAGLVADAQEAQHEAVEAELVVQEDALVAVLDDEVAFMDTVVLGNSQELQGEQAAVEASVDADRVAATENVVEQKEVALDTINSEIWKLGYGQPGAFDPYYDYSVDTANYDDHPIPRSIQHPEDFAQVADPIGHDGVYAGDNFDFNELFYYPGKNEEHDIKVRNAIVDEKDRFYGVVKKTLDNGAARTAQELSDANDRYEGAMADFENQAGFSMEAMNGAIDSAVTSFQGTLDGQKADIESATDDAEAALEAFLQERLADWQEKHDWELDQAKWQRDSYWRYNLIKLLEAKNDAVMAAVNQARADFAASMAAEEAESADFRLAEGKALADFSNETRKSLVDAISEDRANLGAEIEERDSTLTAFLQDELDTLKADVQAEADDFKSEVERLYNYSEIPQYNVEENLEIVPYTEYQHRNFLHKFGFWLNDQLAGLDAQIEDMITSTTLEVAGLSDSADVEGAGLEKENVDARVVHEHDLEVLAEQLLTDYEQTQVEELEALKDARAAAEELALTKAEQFKRDIIYASHVLRFGNSYGYSHFVPKGPNGLTGVDELDRLTYGDLEPAGLLYGHGYGYAQTQSDPDKLHEQVFTENVVDDEHADHLLQALADARQGFADMVQACRDDFQAMVDGAKDDSADRKDNVDDTLAESAAVAMDEQVALDASTQQTLADDNDARYNGFVDSTQVTLDAFNAEVDATIEKVNEWFNKRIHWVEATIDDEYAVHHIVHELEEVVAAAIEELEARKDRAQEVMDSMRAALLANLDVTEADLKSVADEQVVILEQFIVDLLAETAARGAAIEDQFAADADAEADAKNAAMDDLEQKWAYFLKQTFDYEVDGDSLVGYVESQDYSDFPYFDYTELNFESALEGYGIEGDDLYTYTLH